MIITRCVLFLKKLRYSIHVVPYLVFIVIELLTESTGHCLSWLQGFQLVPIHWVLASEPAAAAAAAGSCSCLPRMMHIVNHYLKRQTSMYFLTIRIFFLLVKTNLCLSPESMHRKCSGLLLVVYTSCLHTNNKTIKNSNNSVGKKIRTSRSNYYT